MTTTRTLNRHRATPPGRTLDTRDWRHPQRKVHAIIVLLVGFALAPFYLLLTVSFKNPVQYRYDPWGISFPLRVQNYGAAWDIVQPYIVNTVFVAIVGLTGVLILSIIGGYVFSQMEFPYKEALYFMIIALLTVPWVLSFIPAYMLYYQLGLLNSQWALILSNIAGSPVFGIFLLRTLMAGLPKEMFEAARVDGANILTEMIKIAVPLSLPGIATLATINFVNTWNSFLWPLVVIHDKNKQVISVGIYQLSQGIGSSGLVNWGPLFAGFVIASLPLVIVFIFLGKFYIEGLAASGIKI
jgi:ABC-type glycerol-3-phosphate transport system permease component